MPGGGQLHKQLCYLCYSLAEEPDPILRKIKLIIKALANGSLEFKSTGRLN